MLAVLVLTFAVSVTLTGWARSYAVSRAILDAPTPRSSHTEPTPRGGGIAIVTVVLLIAFALWVAGRLDRGFTWSLVGGGFSVALIGWLDDHRPVSPLLRFCLQLVTAVWAVYNLGFVAELNFGGFQLHLPPVLGWVLTIMGLVWMINLYNFMDGTDGIAAGQAICAGLGATPLVLMHGQSGLAMLLLAIVGSSLGFLRWNWPRARIFMGDVGSGFLGFTFGVLILATYHTAAVPLVVWSLLLGVFLNDATFTLLWRVLRGERIFSAHRSHAYQRLVQMGWSHRRVLVAFLAMNVLVLWPLSFAAVKWNHQLLLIGGLGALMQLGLWLTIQRRAVSFLASAGQA